ncbi:deoxyuridine 5'-triphosphate nucleotidohydrolase [bacterium]|nr:MAG: deoxyuridine 5'-triphosphate nucleotidohydrolase [bacterium]
MLNREEIIEAVKVKRLVEGYMDLDTQVTPNGFDLTAKEIWAFKSCGALDFSNKERVAPDSSILKTKKIKPGDKFGWWHLKQGVYKAVTNEVVNIPKDLTALALPRSSLLRMGATVHTAVWDAGFCGRSEFILSVMNPKGLKLKQNARIAQLIFWDIKEVKEGYRGIYQGTK